MATNQVAAGLNHPTVVPENFDPERCGPDTTNDRDAGAADEPLAGAVDEPNRSAGRSGESPSRSEGR